jgi:hypothetical protein
MHSTALVTSDDLIFRSEARSVLKEMQIACTCSGTIGFQKTIASDKFEAVLLDMPHPDAAVEAINMVRNGKVNRYSIILSFVADGQSASAAWLSGANFTIRRSRDVRNDLRKAFQSVHGLMLREKRRYYRQPVSIDAEFLCDGRRITGKMVDISERGACIECALPVPKQLFRVQFLLPGSAQPLNIEAVPAWTRGKKTGIQFTSLDEASRSTLCQWLLSQLDPKVVNA